MMKLFWGGRIIYILEIRVLVSVIVKIVNEYSYNLFIFKFFSFGGGTFFF